MPDSPIETSDATKISEPQLVLSMQVESCHSELDFFRGMAAGRELQRRSKVRITEFETEQERLRRMLWLIIWDNKGFTQEEIEWAGEYELKLANERAEKAEAGHKEYRRQ